MILAESHVMLSNGHMMSAVWRERAADSLHYTCQYMYMYIASTHTRSALPTHTSELPALIVLGRYMKEGESAVVAVSCVWVCSAQGYSLLGVGSR